MGEQPLASRLLGKVRTGLGTTRMLGSRGDGPPVYTYEAVPGVPPVSATRLGRELSPGGLPQTHAHSHDFLVLAYFERGGGSLRLGEREWPVEAGDVYVIAPGEVVGPGDWEKAVQLLGQGKDINYDGASGPIEFDEKGDVAGIVAEFVVEGDSFKQGAMLSAE